ncbi:hypothetical protein ONS95_007457 [Cadophora gregata]|uniref:uncharacterized protein n=1 Tax=Cadophora gregata TaxID=51156 RepID=UPI0026DAF728|nr:uncharacterized protein ONS95_007457 [Cadophora gregata]KAK0118571.1 hypothetical protein ONS96_011663 [Cadophora gregata f. sp. sojae]KAK0125826.1 hypothetical protein ONS95_007457 [Cadophora gregata]
MSSTAGSASASAAPNGSDDPWTLAKDRFLSGLDPTERDIFNNATLENLFYTTSNENRTDAEKSRVRAVAKKLGPLVSAIESYGKALDTFAQIAPLYLSPIWGSIRVLLILARSYGKFFERVVDTLGRIGDVMPRFRDYERIYCREKHQRLTQALSNAYLDIIELCTQFRKTILEQKTSSLRRLLKPVSLDRQFDEAIERFRQHKKSVDEEARVCYMIEAAEKRNEELTLFAAERKRRLLSRLSTVAFEHKHRKLKALRYEGTGTWLIGDTKYKEWKSSTESAVLCCHGIPGCGKSVLASSIVDSLLTNNTTVYYYCDYSDKRTLDPANLFGALARQVLGKLKSIPETLAATIENAAHDGDRLTDSSCALESLRKGIELCSDPIYISVDGIDELTEESQKTICHGLKDLIDGNSVPIRLFLTGRQDLSSLLHIPSIVPFTSISVAPSVIASDIRNFVQASTRRRVAEGMLVLQDSSLEELIVEKLVNGARGMFLWVEFQLRDLCEAESDYGIRLVLENLPRSLSETYDRLLGRIEGTERRNMILRMFKWIVCTRQPLHVNEIREGIAFTLEDEDWTQEKIPTDLNRLIRACGNLVIVDTETDIVQLAHYTVQQYFLKDDGKYFQFGLGDANEMAGEFCLAYLTFSCFETQVTRYRSNTNTDIVALQKMTSSAALVPSGHPGRKVIWAWNILRGPRTAPRNVNLVNPNPRSKVEASFMSAFHFLPYVVKHWLWHTIDFESSAYTERRDQMFKNLVCWKELLFDFRPWASFSKSTQQSSSTALLGWALMANHRYLLRMASSVMEHCIPAQLVLDAWSNFLLGRKGPVGIHESDVDSLIALQKEPFRSESALDCSLWLLSQLLFACQKGHHLALKEIPFNDTRSTARDFADHLPSFLLLLTAGTGELETIKYLKSYVGVEEQEHLRMWFSPDWWESSLKRAFASRQFETVRYLVRAGHNFASLCSDRGTYESMLKNAVTAGDSEAAECLLHLSPRWPVQTTPDDLADLFILAIQKNLLAVVAQLLHLGAEPNLTSSLNQVPLVEAIRSRNRQMVALLLQYRSSFELTAHGLPLTIAAAMGALAICEMLIAAGAEVFHGSYQDSHGVALIDVSGGPEFDDWEISVSPTPLYMASYYGHSDIVKLLLESGAAPSFPSPTQHVAAVLDPDNVAAGFTYHSYLLRPDGKLYMSKEDIPAKSYTLISQWKYSIEVAIEQGHDDIISMLSGSCSMTATIHSNSCFHQYAIQKAMLHHFARTLSPSEPAYKKFIKKVLEYTDTCLSRASEPTKWEDMTAKILSES